MASMPRLRKIRFIFVLGLFSTFSGNISTHNVEHSPVEAPVAAADQLGEYCQLETMRGRCRWKSEVIVMTSARWGRMKIGRCIDVHQNILSLLGNDPLFLGCSENVLSIADKKCSGRSQCDIRIPDSDLDKMTPCYPDQKSYFEASYTCVKVVQESRSCLANVNNEQQFLSSSSSSTESNTASSCGSRSHPWRLQAPVGQRINISLLDFTSASGAASRDRDVSCYQYGYVTEKMNKKNVSICSAGSSTGTASRQRESAVYMSETNAAEIVLFSGSNIENNNFLIKVNAIGCTNMVPPDNAWLKRSNNDIVIGCYLSQQTWQLKCDGHEWKGQVGTCPETYVSNENPDDLKRAAVDTTDESNKMFMAMIIIAGAAVIICVAVIATGMICLQKCKRTYKKTHCNSTHQDAKYMTAASNSQRPL